MKKIHLSIYICGRLIFSFVVSADSHLQWFDLSCVLRFLVVRSCSLDCHGNSLKPVLWWDANSLRPTKEFFFEPV